MRSSPACSPTQSSSAASFAVTVAISAVPPSLCVLHADIPRFRLPSVSRRPVTACHMLLCGHGLLWFCLRSPSPVRHRLHPPATKPLRPRAVPGGGPATPDLPAWGRSRPGEPRGMVFAWQVTGPRLTRPQLSECSSSPNVQCCQARSSCRGALTASVSHPGRQPVSAASAALTRPRLSSSHCRTFVGQRRRSTPYIRHSPPEASAAQLLARPARSPAFSWEQSGKRSGRERSFSESTRASRHLGHDPGGYYCYQCNSN
ncbi:hypothetical protein NDU88_003346 [Pleurodeles waltl]|uniref:Uncharacterized protein n=1 Tax=Pleurodeles waltl TaxID=8319 RepID=A0AAV7RDM9_PLEWA|nr:hypothetical protein NDU88_003346 [Pleurodeles waltl]